MNATGPEYLNIVPTRAERSGKRSFTRAARLLGALALLATGAVHLQQFVKLYSQVPTIGTLFVLNFAGATVIGIGLLVPVKRIASLLALAGIALAATAFAFLLISEHTPLFGFMEPGYDPPAIAAARAAEVVTVLSLCTFLISKEAMK